jgi:hypothetical protein
VKLNEQQTDQVQRQTGLHPIPDDNPVADTLKSSFGDHTFYVDKNGLYVWEPVEAEGVSQPAAAVMLAEWADEEKTALRPTEPTVSNVVVELEPQPS